MNTTITINIESVLFWLGAIGVIGTAVVWIIKGAQPFLRPFKKIQELDARTHACSIKFENDNKRLQRLEEGMDMMLKSQFLTLKHLETGNCTGEIAEGREALQNFLIDRE